MIIDSSFWQDIKDYFYYIYVIIIGYLTWNHKRLDKVTQDTLMLDEKVNNIEKDLDHIRQGIDKLTYHLLDKKNR